MSLDGQVHLSTCLRRNSSRIRSIRSLPGNPTCIWIDDAFRRAFVPSCNSTMSLPGNGRRFESVTHGINSSS